GLPRPTTRWGPGGRALTVMGLLDAASVPTGPLPARTGRSAPLSAPGRRGSPLRASPRRGGRTTPDTVPGRRPERDAPAPQVSATERTDGIAPVPPAPRGSLLLGGVLVGLGGLGGRLGLLALLVLGLVDARQGDAGNEQLDVRDQLAALGQGDVAGEDLEAVLGALDVDLDLLGHVQRVDQEGQGLQVDEGRRRGDRLAGEDHRDLDLDLLALADDDQVEVGQGALQREALDLLDEREVLGAVREGQLEQRVGVTGRQSGVVTGQREVDRVLAVPVQDGGDAALGAQAARRALAEVLAQFDVQLLSHGVLLVEWVARR